MKKILIKKTCESKTHGNIKMGMKFDRKKTMEDEIIKTLILKIITNKTNSNKKNERPDLKD
jgi:hypothetical protein